MSKSKARAAIHVVPPPAAEPKKPKVRVSHRHVPGTVVRRPDIGLYYEVAPVDQGRYADTLQRALLHQYTPKQVVMVRGFFEDWIARMVEMIDRMWFGFTAMFGVTR